MRVIQYNKVTQEEEERFIEVKNDEMINVLPEELDRFNEMDEQEKLEYQRLQELREKVKNMNFVDFKFVKNS